MKKHTTIIIILLFSLVSYAQKGIVYYGFIDAKATGNAKGPDTNSYLLFNKEMSYFVTAKDSLEKPGIQNESLVFETEEGNVIHNGTKVSAEGDQVVYNIKKNTMWSNLLYKKQVYVKEQAPKINWKITTETKKIGTFICTKATAKFRGRNYIAWFTTEVPVTFGPWKLNGLPGLILEAYDENKFVYWYFKSVEYPTKNKEKVRYLKAPATTKVLSYAEFKNFQREQKQKLIEKSRMVEKDFPGVEFAAPQLSLMFVECE